MAENVTTPTGASVEAFIDRIEHPVRKRDAQQLLRMMREVTGQDATMWGPTIIGFGHHHYVYASGRQGVAPCVGFAPRRANLVLYGLTSAPESGSLLPKLGKHKTGAACLYVNKLDDVDMGVLRELTRLGHEHLSTTSRGFVPR